MNSVTALTVPYADSDTQDVADQVRALALNRSMTVRKQVAQFVQETITNLTFVSRAKISSSTVA